MPQGFFGGGVALFLFLLMGAAGKEVGGKEVFKLDAIFNRHDC